MNKKVIIIGAGVDKSKGIEFPLANQLITELVRFTENEGKVISETVKKQLPQMRFSFKNFVKTGIDGLLESDNESDTLKVVKRVKDLSEKYSTDRIDLFMQISSKLDNIKSGNYIDENTLDIIKKIYGEDDIDLTENNLLDLKFFTFTDLFRKVIGLLLEESIGIKQQSNEEGDKELYNLLLNQYLDFEKLLVDTFIGFYTKKQSDIKKYIYISWMLWAYLCWKESKITYSIDGLPVYSKIPDKWNVITFNYTSFARKYNSSALYFHGSLNEYIRLDNRNTVNIDLDKLNSIDDIKMFLEKNIKQEIDKEIYFIPSIIPPLKLKPIISMDFLERWHKGKELIENADELIVVGYSFASADEHINDILRQYKSKKVTIINPAYKNIIPMIKKIYRVHDESDFTMTTIQDKEALKVDNITIINAFADDIDYYSL